MPYVKKIWRNRPALTTPVDAAGLNHLETQYDHAMEDVRLAVGDPTTPIGVRLEAATAAQIASEGTVVAAAAGAVDDALEDSGLVRRTQPQALQAVRVPGVGWYSSATPSADGTRLNLGSFVEDEQGNITPESAERIAEAVRGAPGFTRRPVTRLAVKGDSMSSYGKIPTVAGAWPLTVAGALGLDFRLPSIPGENPMDALFRTGVPIKVSGLTQIPATTAEFVLSASQVNEGATGHRNTTTTDGSGIATGAGLGQFDMTVMGVPMRFRRVVNTEGGYTVGQWRVNRITAGQAVPIAPGVDVYATATGAAESRDGLWFFADGRNDMNAARIIDTNQRVIDWLGHALWFVIAPVLISAGEVDGSFGSARAVINTMSAHYGEKFIDWQPVMASTDALAMAGITPTSQDLADIAVGLVPSSLRTDGTHFNDLGLQVWGQIILEMVTPLLAALGYEGSSA